MGNTPATETTSNSISQFASSIQEFNAHLLEANQLIDKYLEGKLIFLRNDNPNSDHGPFWRLFVFVELKKKGETKPGKSLNYKQFYQIFQNIKECVSLMKEKESHQGASLLDEKMFEEEEGECSICMEQCSEMVVLGCLHSFCSKCLEKWKSKNGTTGGTCPFCRCLIDNNSGDEWILTGTSNEEIKTYLSSCLDKYVS